MGQMGINISIEGVWCPGAASRAYRYSVFAVQAFGVGRGRTTRKKQKQQVTALEVPTEKAEGTSHGIGGTDKGTD